MYVVTVDEMRRIEAAADESGHSYAEMMERAGRRVAEAVQARQGVKGKRVLILVGPGNNGGDGLVAARFLAQAGAEVACYLLKPRDTEDVNFRSILELELFVGDVTKDQRWRVLRRLTAGADVIIDALLGTGANLPLEGAVANLLGQVKEGIKTRRAGQGAARALVQLDRPSGPHSVPLVVAVDGPSGLDYDTGELDPQALMGDITVTFGFPKRGHFLFPGAQACGELTVADIGVDAKLAQGLLSEPTVEVVTAEMVGALLPDRPRSGHKGTFGKALLVAGSINYTGAAYLAAAGATRVGAGLVTLAVPAAIHSTLAAKISEATFLIMPQAMGIISPNAVELLTEKMRGYQALLLGPGLTQEKEAVEFVHKLFQLDPQSKRRGRIGFQTSSNAEEAELTDERSVFPPLVVDADGLNALAQLDHNEWWQRLPQPSVLTPHPGEMARLMDVTTSEMQDDRWSLARDMAARWGHVVLLKGAFTVVANPDGRTVILPFATSSLATAGSGDVLAGAVVGLLAQGMKPFDAAVAGAYLHGLAGKWAGEEIGLAGTVASDLLPRLPQALRAVDGKS